MLRLFLLQRAESHNQSKTLIINSDLLSKVNKNYSTIKES